MGALEAFGALSQKAPPAGLREAAAAWRGRPRGPWGYPASSAARAPAPTRNCEPPFQPPPPTSCWCDSLVADDLPLTDPGRHHGFGLFGRA